MFQALKLSCCEEGAFPLFPPPLILSVDASAVVPAGVPPSAPLGSSPSEAGQFCHPHGEKGSLRPPPHGEQMGRDAFSAEFIKSPLKFYSPEMAQ